jgi:hypothetical protein
MASHTDAATTLDWLGFLSWIFVALSTREEKVAGIQPYIGGIRKRDIWPRSCSGLARLKFCSSSIRENPRPLLFNLPFSSSSHGKGKLIEVM